jgi:hypothetical protein
MARQPPNAPVTTDFSRTDKQAVAAMILKVGSWPVTDTGRVNA